MIDKSTPIEIGSLSTSTPSQSKITRSEGDAVTAGRPDDNWRIAGAAPHPLPGLLPLRTGRRTMAATLAPPSPRRSRGDVADDRLRSPLGEGQRLRWRLSFDQSPNASMLRFSRIRALRID